MASSTPSANTAQRAPGQPLDDGAIQNSQDSTAEPKKGTAGNSALPNGHRTVPRIIDGPQPDADEDDDPPAPFPPYREPDETGGHEDVESHDHDPLHISAQGDSTPLSTADEGATHSESTAEPIAAIAAEPTHETIAVPLSPPLQTSEQTSEQASEPVQEAEPEPFVQPTPLSPLASPPAPPPPYWTHSRDGSQGNNTSLDVGRPATAAASTGRTNAEISFSAPFFRRLDTSSRSQGTASSISSATQRPSTSSTNPSSLYIGSRGAAATGNGRTSYQGHHRRDTSSSTLDGNVNLITLQDNEAAEDDGYGSSGGWQYNGATPAAGAPASSSSALLSPAASALRHPGPPPGNSGSGNTSPLAAPRTTNHPPKNVNYNRCWARRVDVTDHVVIGAGNSSTMVAHPRLGAFVVWTIRVQTLEGSSGNPYFANNGNAPTPRSPNNASSPSPSSSAGHSFCIYKRYSEFDTLRRRLLASFPQARGGGALPPLPPKSVLGKFRPDFLEKRRLGLQYFLNCILLNPEFAGSPVLKEFLFS
ncbi:hypothetical protein HMPREF1624_04384 [Sporothrix schenckii ATCC 58251]|uniref:Endosomal/vacuolar adapter protein YPT35 n=1 Tax=Sporothrix schenckii (strain ATCC 58251 / de Perez 2211183) TaxID=1391915 RepID=U7PU80_SPOS1|nr:hypothetical protein HMPREF1624_04384 [Sporothrix schenckii ATCC 58251]